MKHKFSKTEEEIHKAFFDNNQKIGRILESPVITNVLLWEILKKLNDDSEKNSKANKK